YRAPLLLCCLEGKTRDEAARELGWPVCTLKSRLEEARRLLRLRLARRGLPLPAALLASLFIEAAPPVLPAGLARTTAGAALAFAAGQGSASAAPVALAQGLLEATVAVRTRLAVALILLLCVIG